jgi:hypothetical protein
MMPLDQFHGHGGSYVVNPDTQERELVERTLTEEEAAAAEESKAAPKAATKPGKEK